jgi:hypothetical protein
MLPEGREAKAILVGILLLVAGICVLFGAFLIFPRRTPDAGDSIASRHSVALSVLLITVNFCLLCGLELLALRLAQYLWPFRVPYADQIAAVLAILNAVVGAYCPALGVFRLVQQEVKVPEPGTGLGAANANRLHSGLVSVWAGLALALISIVMPVIISVPALFLSIRGLRILRNGPPLTRIGGWIGLVIASLTLTIVPLILFVALMAAVIH